MKVKLLLFMIILFGLIVMGQLEITDSLGRKVIVPDNVERIVAVGPGALRIIVYLNSTDKVVGVEDFERTSPLGRPYILAHPELKELPSIGPGGPGKLPNLEAILKLKPDVVFSTYIDKRTADNIQNKLNIPVVVLSYGTLKDFEDKSLFNSLELTGKILGKTDRALEVISFITNIQKELKERTADSKSPTAYVGGIGYRGAHGIDSTKPDYPIFNVLKIKNVAGDIDQEHVFIDREKLLLWQPEFVFVDEGGLELVIEDYMKNPEFYEFLEAFKTGKIYGLLPYNYYTTNIGTALADAYFVGKVVYPEKFKDVVPEKKADEIYEFLVGRAVYNKMKEQFGGFGKLNLKEKSIVPVR